ncbi:MAG: Ig-like domain-containing protein, partial [Bryocella sp.]
MRMTRNYSLWLASFLTIAAVIGCCSPNTSQLIAPSAITFAPVALSNTSCPTATVSIGFSEAMNPATINSSTFTLNSSSGAVSGAVTYNATTKVALFTPSALLLAGTTYTAALSTGVRDQYGNPLAAAYINSFTTAANGCHAPPTVALITPATGAAVVCPTSAVVVTFSEPMNPATVIAADFTLSGGVIGTVT